MHLNKIGVYALVLILTVVMTSCNAVVESNLNTSNNSVSSKLTDTMGPTLSSYYEDTPLSQTNESEELQSNTSNIDCSAPNKVEEFTLYSELISKHFLGVWRADNGEEFIIGSNADYSCSDFISRYGLIDEVKSTDEMVEILCVNYCSDKCRLVVDIDNPDIAFYYDESMEKQIPQYQPTTFTRIDNAEMYPDIGEVNGYIRSMLNLKYGYLALSVDIASYTNDGVYYNADNMFDSITVLESHDSDKLTFVSAFVDTAAEEQS